MDKCHCGSLKNKTNYTVVCSREIRTIYFTIVIYFHYSYLFLFFLNSHPSLSDTSHFIIISIIIIC